MNLQILTLRKKLLVGFSVIGLITIITGLFGLVATKNINKEVIEIGNNWMPSVQNVMDMNIRISEIRYYEYRHILNTDGNEMKNVENLISAKLKAFEESKEKYLKLINSDQEKKDFDDFLKNWNEYWIVHENILALSRSNRNDEAKEMMFTSSYEAFTKAKKDLDDLVEVNKKGAANAVLYAENSYKNNRLLIIIIVLMAVIITIFSSVYLTRLILNDVGGEPQEVSKITAKIAEGNLTMDFAEENNVKGIYGSVLKMAVTLKDMIEKIQLGANHIASASQQISSTAEQLSQGATEQASSVEEISSSMEQMTSNIQQNTDNATQTEAISNEAAQGITKVKKAALESNESVGMIAEKIQIINDIAFQTNILALNAAVEAARAGEHGRGFAVVAAEVRKLAERSKIAAEEINILANKSVGATNESFTLLEQIIPRVENTSNLVKEISASSREQSIGTDQINNGIQGLNQVTQQTAAASEELATSAEEMASQAEQLRETISYFKTHKRR